MHNKWLFRLTHPAWLGTLRRTTPLSTQFGYDADRLGDESDCQRTGH